jgi:DNA-binding NtrC family response regulator
MADEIRDDAARQAFFSVELDQDHQPPTLAELEKRYLHRLLEFAGGNRSKVARILEVSYPTVTRKIAMYGIKVPD